MEFELAKAKPESVKASLIVVAASGPKLKKGSSLDRMDRQMKGSIRKILKREDFKGKDDESKLIHTHQALPAHAILILGTSFERKGDLAINTLEYLRRGAGQAAKVAKQLKARSLAFDLTSWPPKGFSESEGIQAIVEGILLGAYHFSIYSKEAREKPHPLKSVQILTGRVQAAHRKALKRGQAAADGTCLARDLVNTPACDMTPVRLGKQASGSPSPIQVKVYTKKEIEKMKMGSLLAVGRGSEHPPTLIHMSYRPKGRSRGSIALIGKGVTFDSGGISLKPPSSMETMKDDMAGAAVVIGVMQAVASLHPQVTVHAIVAAAENMPSGSAIKPGDIVKAMNGKTIEVLNTDAEGRLTLADALSFALKKKPDVIIDIATLTGACLVALGERCSGLMGNDNRLMLALRKSAEKCGERIWQLPLIEEYSKDLKSPIADIKNVGGRWGGTIEAGLFLKEFIDGARWAHIDIAGPSWANKDLPYETKGGTGAMVRTLIDFILNY